MSCNSFVNIQISRDLQTRPQYMYCVNKDKFEQVLNIMGVAYTGVEIMLILLMNQINTKEKE